MSRSAHLSRKRARIGHLGYGVGEVFKDFNRRVRGDNAKVAEKILAVSHKLRGKRGYPEKFGMVKDGINAY